VRRLEITAVADQIPDIGFIKQKRGKTMKNPLLQGRGRRAGDGRGTAVQRSATHHHSGAFARCSGYLSSSIPLVVVGLTGAGGRRAGGERGAARDGARQKKRLLR